MLPGGDSLRKASREHPASAYVCQKAVLKISRSPYKIPVFKFQGGFESLRLQAGLSEQIPEMIHRSVAVADFVPGAGFDGPGYVVLGRTRGIIEGISLREI